MVQVLPQPAIGLYRSRGTDDRERVEQREMLAANQAILKRLAESDKTLLQDDTAVRDINQKRVLDSLRDYFRCT